MTGLVSPFFGPLGRKTVPAGSSASVRSSSSAENIIGLFPPFPEVDLEPPAAGEVCESFQQMFDAEPPTPPRTPSYPGDEWAKAKDRHKRPIQEEPCAGRERD